MKRIFFTLLFLLFLVAFLFFFIFIWWQYNSQPYNPKDNSKRRFVITRGLSASQVGTMLEEQGLIRSAQAFKIYTQLTGSQKNIKPGQYELSPNLSLKDIVLRLLAGPQELWVTYPEGLRREEIAVRTIKVLGIEGERQKEFWQEFLKESEDMEGFLFPDTYLFPKDITAKQVVAKLRQTFDQKIKDKVTKETIILASIVEKETKTDEERPVVAGILLKRLKTPGWRLQADATLQYITGKIRCGSLPLSEIFNCNWWTAPRTEDKKLNSPYNKDGLPPSPIANPGLSSIKSVLFPQESDYWYYLHDKEGKVHFAKTIQEHNINIEKYLR
jgi:UPF0755 protein